MTNARPRRSALYMPASNARAIEKARSLPCDVVILDLEDAVAPDGKTEARGFAIEAIRAGGFGEREVVLRVNGLETPWGAEDLAAAKAAKPDAVLIPKISTPDDLAGYAAGLGGAAPIWAMIETCKAILKLDDLAAAAANVGVTTWVLGTNDLAKEMRCPLTPDRAPLVPALALSLTAARAYSLTILDGVFNEIGDEAGLVAQCGQAVAFGFDGKTLIHPTQIEAANRAFTPDAEAVRWARTVVEAFARPENAGQGVLKVEGRMVERLHLAEAKRLLAVAEAIASHGQSNLGGAA